MKNLIHNLLLALKSPRWRWALLTAVVSDGLGFGVSLFPPIQWVLDGATVVVLFAVLGFRWPLLPAQTIEVVPGLTLFPAWTLVVAALANTEKAPQGVADSQQNEHQLLRRKCIHELPVVRNPPNYLIDAQL